ncbi:IscS subfamily cysteine desulfurase [Niallia sp. NCCP-28]|uniref:IscS subfamily cysteine desulfurase n=1 Tax=Niallia sp. NCCP-28 TaxID=2934712 RepID=UPI00207D9891|nr:IscS subfamily cysteine desulfurase [Niallia sp. NCCP-28]GKU82671.1 cysteine desulfurase [Niallia sp. NCCP-28]
MIYLDYAATCPIDEDALLGYMEISKNYFANTNSLHDIGGDAYYILENCRKQLANLLGIQKEGLYFTSGGSESNFLAIHALLSSLPSSKNHIIAAMGEHSSIHSTIKILEQKGYEITYIPYTASGAVDLAVLENSIQTNTALVSIQHVNSETGAIQPIEEISFICRKYHLLFHSDLVQSFGKLPIPELSKMIDGFSLSSHKFYGPKGVGACYIHPRLNGKSFYPNTTHENGFRPGTVNTPGIAAMVIAANKANQLISEETIHYKKLRQLFLEKTKNYPSLSIIENKAQLPSIIAFRIKQVEGQWVLLESNRKGFAISTGSACQVGHQAPSKTMKALGYSDEAAKELVRISFGRNTSPLEVEQFAATLEEISKNIHQIK